MVYSSVVLVIFDGFGVAPAWGGNAIIVVGCQLLRALNVNHMPFEAAEAVGLGPNEPGNSEVGHLNLGPAGLRFRSHGGLVRRWLIALFENAALLRLLRNSIIREEHST